MSAQALPPKRIADYFFMVGLNDDFPLLDQPQAAHPQEYNANDECLEANMLNGNESAQTRVHSSLFNGDTSNGNTFHLPLSDVNKKSITIKTPTRARSKSMAQVARPLFKQTVPELSESLSDDEQQIR
ncbi:hypothetical protein BGX26_003583, partial [Mortierella sp. AD094]